MKTRIIFQILGAVMVFVNILPVSAQNWQWSHHLGSDREERVKGVTEHRSFPGQIRSAGE
ncbi:MAG: hypothetical protein NT004_10385 [Bacteroidetes bacterium]|nr:hypothetical protein [Bacteroidota bacterium]